VSFANIQVREGLAFGVGVGYYFFLNGVGHPNGPWAEVDSGTVTHPSKVQVLDEIYTGTGPPPFGNGSVTWPIPWLFKVDIVSGLEKEFAPVTHFQEANTLGTAFISKGGVSRSRAATDPTTEW
jgi:hypothetical protein